VWERI